MIIKLPIIIGNFISFSKNVNYNNAIINHLLFFIN